jgi:hypothetical protein
VNELPPKHAWVYAVSQKRVYRVLEHLEDQARYPGGLYLYRACSTGYAYGWNIDDLEYADKVHAEEALVLSYEEWVERMHAHYPDKEALRDRLKTYMKTPCDSCQGELLKSHEEQTLRCLFEPAEFSTSLWDTRVFAQYLLRLNRKLTCEQDAA